MKVKSETWLTPFVKWYLVVVGLFIVFNPTLFWDNLIHELKIAYLTQVPAVIAVVLLMCLAGGVRKLFVK